MERWLSNVYIYSIAYGDQVFSAKKRTGSGIVISSRFPLCKLHANKQVCLLRIAEEYSVCY